jgi:hypothetical protein
MGDLIPGGAPTQDQQFDIYRIDIPGSPAKVLSLVVLNNNGDVGSNLVVNTLTLEGDTSMFAITDGSDIFSQTELDAMSDDSVITLSMGNNTTFDPLGAFLTLVPDQPPLYPFISIPSSDQSAVQYQKIHLLNASNIDDVLIPAQDFTDSTAVSNGYGFLVAYQPSGELGTHTANIIVSHNASVNSLTIPLTGQSHAIADVVWIKNGSVVSSYDFGTFPSNIPFSNVVFNLMINSNVSNPGGINFNVLQNGGIYLTHSGLNSDSATTFDISVDTSGYTADSYGLINVVDNNFIPVTISVSSGAYGQHQGTSVTRKLRASIDPSPGFYVSTELINCLLSKQSYTIFTGDNYEENVSLDFGDVQRTQDGFISLTIKYNQFNNSYSLGDFIFSDAYSGTNNEFSLSTWSIPQGVPNAASSICSLTSSGERILKFKFNSNFFTSSPIVRTEYAQISPGSFGGVNSKALNIQLTATITPLEYSFHYYFGWVGNTNSFGIVMSYNTNQFVDTIDNIPLINIIPLTFWNKGDLNYTIKQISFNSGTFIPAGSSAPSNDLVFDTDWFITLLDTNTGTGTVASHEYLQGDYATSVGVSIVGTRTQSFGTTPGTNLTIYPVFEVYANTQQPNTSGSYAVNMAVLVESESGVQATYTIPISASVSALPELTVTDVELDGLPTAGIDFGNYEID